MVGESSTSALTDSRKRETMDLAWAFETSKYTPTDTLSSIRLHLPIPVKQRPSPVIKHSDIWALWGPFPFKSPRGTWIKSSSTYSPALIVLSMCRCTHTWHLHNTHESFYAHTRGWSTLNKPENLKWDHDSHSTEMILANMIHRMTPLSHEEEMRDSRQIDGLNLILPR